LEEEAVATWSVKVLRLPNPPRQKRSKRISALDSADFVTDNLGTKYDDFRLKSNTRYFFGFFLIVVVDFAS
jgi:hypothetical protein